MTSKAAVRPVPFHPGLFDEPVAGEPRLIASRCRSCGRHAFPAKRFCSFCQAGDPESVHLSGRGRIYAFTHVALPPKVMGKPYIAAYVDMDESVRIFAQIVDIPVGDLRIGDRVRVDFRTLSTDGDGRSVVGYAFVVEREASR